MSNDNSSMVIVMSMMMGLSGFMISSSIALAVGVFVYREYFKDGGSSASGILTAGWTDVEMKLPEKAKNHTDDNCVYFYDHGKKWTDGNGKDGTINNSGQWCLDDGVDKHVPIWYAKGQQGSLSHNSVDYIRLGKNLDLTLWNDHNRVSGDNFRGAGGTYSIRGKDYGLSKLIHVGKDTTLKQNDIDAFMISKAVK